MGKSQNDLIKLFLLLRVDSSSAINVVGDVNLKICYGTKFICFIF